MTLSSDEYNLLTKIAEKSKMDCWFLIKQTAKGEDYVYDIENRKRISLRTGIRQLMEGIDGMYDMYFEDGERDVMISLLTRLI